MMFARAIIILTCAAAVIGCQRINQYHAVDHYVAGQMALDNEDFQRALDELGKALQYDPRMALAHEAIGDIHRRTGNFVQAATAYEAACKINPYVFRPHYNLGVTYKALSDGAENPQDCQNFIHKAVMMFLRANNIQPDDFDTNLNLSVCYFQQGKYELAEQYCLSAMELSPENPFVHCNLGIIYDAQGRPTDAIKAYRQSLELDTHQPRLLLNMGSTYLRLGRIKDALNCFNLCILEDQNSAAPWVQIGACHFQQKDFKAALSDYQKALDLDAQSAEASRGMGVVLMAQAITQAKDDLRPQAVAYWQKSLELQPNQPDLAKLLEKYGPPKE